MGHLSVPSWRGQGPSAALAALFVLTGLLAASGARLAQAAVPEPPGGRIEQTPEALRDVGIDEHLGRSIPLNLPFRDSAGAPVQLHELVAGRRPVILTLNYADCPMLCNLQLDGLADAMRQVSLVPGKDFDLITVSINPAETPERTRAFAAKYHALLGLPEGSGAGSADAAWHFLAGEQDSISRLAQATGFKYGYVKSEQEFAHTAAFMVLSPDGQITRYIYGVLFEPRDLRLALVEAAEGKVGSTLDRILLFCFHYDAATGRYAPMAQNIMRLGGFVTMLVLGAALGIYWRREIRAKFQGGPSRPGA
jgi:protein SCO1/2